MDMESGASGGATLGKSILVPSVQELAKQPISTVPARHVRPDRDDSAVSEDHGSEVPVVDMQRLILGDSEELAKLHSACRDWGFFQVVKLCDKNFRVGADGVIFAMRIFNSDGSEPELSCSIGKVMVEQLLTCGHVELYSLF